MTKTKSTKSALLMSALALLMCFSMLIGSTFAWFTDSVTSGNNIIKSGNLDMEVSYKPYGAEYTEWTKVDENTVIFGKDALYEPGYTEAVWLKVENLGSLAFRYDLAVNVASEKLGKTKDGADIKLSDYLEVKYMTTTSTDMESNFYTTRESLNSFAFGSAANSGVASLSNDIAVIKNGVAFSADDAVNGAYSSAYVLVVISMPTTVGNEANHDGKHIPEINFALTAMATQVPNEKDSFGSDYDADADYVAYYNVPGEYTLNANMKATKATDVITADGEGVVLNIVGGTYDAGDMDCVVWAKNGAVVNIYGGTFTHNGDGSEATSAHHFDMIYAGANGGKINIYGGTFSAKSGGVWLLNEKDNQGEIVVYGGNFVNWNPADNVSEGANTNFLGEDRFVESETKDNGDVYYTVTSNNVEVTTGEEFVNALKNLENGEIVKLMNDIELGDVDIVLQDWTVTGTTEENGATVNVVKYANNVYNIDLNGYELSATAHAIELHGGTLNIKNGTISMDSATQDGTFITVGGHSPVYDAHKVAKCGQDDYNPASVLNLENVTFEGSTAVDGGFATSGHAIYVTCHGQVHIRNCTFDLVMENGVYANPFDVYNNASDGVGDGSGSATVVYVYEGTKFYGDPTYQAWKDAVNTDWEVNGGIRVYIADGYNLEAAPIADGDTYAWYTVVAE